MILIAMSVLILLSRLSMVMAGAIWGYMLFLLFLLNDSLGMETDISIISISARFLVVPSSMKWCTSRFPDDTW